MQLLLGKTVTWIYTVCSRIFVPIFRAVTVPYFFSYKTGPDCAKASIIFSTKNISVFGYKLVKHLTS